MRALIGSSGGHALLPWLTEQPILLIAAALLVLALLLSLAWRRRQRTRAVQFDSCVSLLLGAERCWGGVALLALERGATGAAEQSLLDSVSPDEVAHSLLQDPQARLLRYSERTALAQQEVVVWLRERLTRLSAVPDSITWPQGSLLAIVFAGPTVPPQTPSARTLVDHLRTCHGVGVVACGGSSNAYGTHLQRLAPACLLLISLGFLGMAAGPRLLPRPALPGSQSRTVVPEPAKPPGTSRSVPAGTPEAWDGSDKVETAPVDEAGKPGDAVTSRKGAGQAESAGPARSKDKEDPTGAGTTNTKLRLGHTDKPKEHAVKGEKFVRRAQAGKAEKDGKSAKDGQPSPGKPAAGAKDGGAGGRTKATKATKVTSPAGAGEGRAEDAGTKAKSTAAPSGKAESAPAKTTSKTDDGGAEANTKAGKQTGAAGNNDKDAAKGAESGSESTIFPAPGGHLLFVQ